MGGIPEGGVEALGGGGTKQDTECKTVQHMG